MFYNVFILCSFMVLRTRINTSEEAVPPMAHTISDFLSQRFAQVIIKQRLVRSNITLNIINPIARLFFFSMSLIRYIFENQMKEG
jgi:hypothetical protein